MNRNAGPSSLIDRFPALGSIRTGNRIRTIPVVRQLASTECGPACLSMVLGYYGKHATLSEIREAMGGAGRDGVDSLTLLKTARWYGLQGRGVTLQLNALPFMEKGTILHWEFSHFVVFDRLRKGGVEIVDPARGRRLVPLEEFGRSFTGVALTLMPGADFQTSASQSRPIWNYLKYLAVHSGLIWRALVMSLLLQIFSLAAPALTGLLVNSVVPHGDIHLLHLAGAALLGIAVFQYLSTLTRSHLLLYLRTQLDARMTLGFVGHLASLPYSFFQQRAQGDLMVRVNSNENIREMLTSNTLSALLDGSLAILYFVILLAASPTLAAVAFVLGLLQGLVFALSYRRYQDLMSEDLQAQSKSQSQLIQILSGIETLKASGAEDGAVQQWSNAYVDRLNVSLMRGRLSATVDSLINALRMSSPLLMLWFGGLQVLNGSISLGTMLALNAIAIGFLGPVSTLITSGLQLQLLRSYVERIDDVLGSPAEQDKRVVRKSERPSGAIELKGVSFRYESTESAGVENISVKIRSGEMVAIVGRSGAGKSTLAKLMLGLYKPSLGRVLYDSADIAGLDLQSLRRQLGVVTQRSYVFGTTILENITLNDSTVPLCEVTRAAELACIHEDITSMPMGYDTIVTEGGGSLSGGQRQRLAIARALVHDPAILLLDEATSELDTITERAVHRNLAELRCTRIVIAHRLSTVRDADRILVMDGGRIVEQGVHEELIAKGGHYAQLVEGSGKQPGERFSANV
jgi:ATP-binding cassette subfamily B protein